MKISIKKRHVAIIMGFLTIVLGWSFFLDFYEWLLKQNLKSLLPFLLFTVSLIYSVIYLLSLKNKENMAKDIGKEQYPNNPLKAQDLQDHLWRNCIEESYSINFYKGSIKFTTTWSQQKEYEKYKNIPEVVRRELR